MFHKFSKFRSRARAYAQVCISILALRSLGFVSISAHITLLGEWRSISRQILVPEVLSLGNEVRFRELTMGVWDGISVRE